MRKMFFFKLSLFRVYVLVLGFSLVTVCSCAGNHTKALGVKPQYFSKTLIQADEYVHNKLSDSICDILFHPQAKARLYTIDINAKGDAEGRRFGKFLVKDYLGSIKDNYLSCLTSMMADSSFYVESPVRASAPFLPDAALELSFKKQKVVLLFCFNVNEFAILENDGSLRYIPYGYNALVTQFFNRMFVKKSENNKKN